MAARKTHMRHRDVAFDYPFPACHQGVARAHNSNLSPKISDDPERVTCLACQREIRAGRTRLPFVEIAGLRGDEQACAPTDHCVKWGCDKAVLEKQGQFWCCPKCGASYGDNPCKRMR